MAGKIFAVVAAALALVGAAFAYGAMGNGYGGGMGGLQEKAQEIADDVRIAFMKAVHEGDYATAKSLSGEYGIGGRMIRDGSEAEFNLRFQMRQAMDSGNYAQALEIQEQMRELRQQQMEQRREEMAKGQPEGFAKGARMGFKAGFARGMRQGAGMGSAEGCPYSEATAAAESADAEAGTVG